MSWLSDLKNSVFGSSQTTTPVYPPGFEQGYQNISNAANFNYQNQPQWAQNLPSTHVPMSPTTQQGVNALAGQGSPLYGVSQNALQGLIAGMPGLNAIASGATGISMPGANPYQGDLASFGANANPRLDEMFKRGASQIRDATTGAFAGRGLSGSVAPKMFANQLASRLGDFATDLYGGAFDAMENRRFGGLSGAASLFADDLNRGIGVQGQNIANQMGAAGMRGNQILGSLGGLGTLADYGLRGPLNQIAAGQMGEDYQRDAALDYRNRFEGDRDRQWDLLDRAAGVIFGAPLGKSTSDRPSGWDAISSVFDFFGNPQQR